MARGEQAAFAVEPAGDCRNQRRGGGAEARQRDRDKRRRGPAASKFLNLVGEDFHPLPAGGGKDRPRMIASGRNRLIDQAVAQDEGSAPQPDHAVELKLEL